MDEVKRPGREMAIRKRLRKRAERTLAGSHLAPHPWRWVHGVLYASNGRTIASQSDAALGMDGLQKPVEHHERDRYKSRPVRREETWGTARSVGSRWY